MREAIVRTFPALLWLACGAVAPGSACPAIAAESPREVHGSADMFAAPGVALAWGVLRGATEVATVVIVRVATDRDTFAALEVVGRDPFTRQERPVLPITPAAASIDVHVPRAHFADFPRTEFRLFATASPAQNVAPRLVVFYLGVPDTTPEFPSAGALESYLAVRIAQARASAGSKPP